MVRSAAGKCHFWSFICPTSKIVGQWVGKKIGKKIQSQSVGLGKGKNDSSFTFFSELPPPLLSPPDLAAD
jgi:hypothetical protein